jgi:hypothetical protein
MTGTIRTENYQSQGVGIENATRTVIAGLTRDLSLKA